MKTIEAKIQVASCEKVKDAIRLGFQGETGARCISFDLSEMIATYGDGVFRVLHKRSRDSESYEVANTKREGNNLIWTVDDVDTAMSGNGKGCIILAKGDDIAKTVMFKTYVERSEKTGGFNPSQPCDHDMTIDSIDLAKAMREVYGE